MNQYDPSTAAGMAYDEIREGQRQRLRGLCPSDATACSPLRVAYSRAELADKLKDWMIDLWGDIPKNLDPEQRDQWHRDNGMIYHFICDHFPAENTTISGGIPSAASSVLE